jgi:hypothetical protein
MAHGARPRPDKPRKGGIHPPSWLIYEIGSSYRFLLAVDFFRAVDFFAEDFLVDFFAEDFFADFLLAEDFFADFLLAEDFLAGIVHLLSP